MSEAQGPVRVYLGVGSNIDRERHIRAGLDALAATFGQLDISPVYESEAVGFSGDPFFNLVVGLQTQWPVARLSRFLKGVEVANGRKPESSGLNAKTLDLDILTYGELAAPCDGVELPRGEILANAFVLRPLADIAGHERHPVTGISYRDHWQAWSGTQRLWPVAFCWPL